MRRVAARALSTRSAAPPFQVRGALTQVATRRSFAFCTLRSLLHLWHLAQLARGQLPAIGVDAHVTHAFSLADTARFAQLTGDSNPIHSDGGDAPPIVQGMLSASLFATIFGRTVPGAVYVSQQLRWRAPLHVDEQVRARIRVVKLRKRFVDCETVCEKVASGEVVVEGVATVLLPPAES